MQILIAKKDQMFELAKELGSDGEQDPSLLHPLFARIPPLYSDTPENCFPPLTDPLDDPNPYTPIPLSKLFQLADELMIKWPWDGAVIRGKDFMGGGSVVRTYELEMANRAGDLDTALEWMDRDVVKPRASIPDDEEEETVIPVRRRRRSRIQPRKKLGATLALGVVILGIGLTTYGSRSGAARGDWTKWWAWVIRKWIGKNEKAAMLMEGYARIVGYLRQTLRDLL